MALPGIDGAIECLVVICLITIIMQINKSLEQKHKMLPYLMSKVKIPYKVRCIEDVSLFPVRLTNGAVRFHPDYSIKSHSLLSTSPMLKSYIKGLQFLYYLIPILVMALSI